jgi:predicted thioesterase
MFEAIQPGVAAELTLLVEPRHTATHWGSGGVDVLATPQMIGLMEQAAVLAIDGLLPEGHKSVGTVVHVAHLAATPVGRTVTARAEVVAVAGRKVSFSVVAFDERNKIGEGTHERVIINLERFMARVVAPSSG